LDLKPSRANALEFCLGSLAEMTEGDIYEAVEQYSRQQKLAYVHFRNVTGKVPFYRETFIDDGDIDMMRILQILKRNNYDGVLIPDHTPQMSCSAPWHAGMAYRAWATCGRRCRCWRNNLMEKPFSLKGEIALITGGGSGLGPRDGNVVSSRRARRWCWWGGGLMC
jgi:hypothetical protein